VEALSERGRKLANNSRIRCGLQNDSDYGDPAAQNNSSPSSNTPTQRSNDGETNDVPKQNARSDESDISRVSRITDCVQKVRVARTPPITPLQRQKESR